MTTAGHLLERRAFDPDYSERVFLRTREESYSWRETWSRAVGMANLFHRLTARGTGPLHVGILSENRPEFVFALFGCALAGGTLVALNPTRSGESLARDVDHTECRILLVDEALLDRLIAIRPRLRAFDDDRILVSGNPGCDARLPAGASALAERLGALCAEDGESFARPPAVAVRPEDPLVIIFTSGTTGSPKAILNSHRKVVAAPAAGSGPVAFTEHDVFYAAMPLFHSNSLGQALVPALVHGATLALARRFSATGFLADVRRFHATVFNYVGKPLAYILATPERPDDAQNTLRVAVGSGATGRQQDEFARRFGLEHIIEMYGSTEAGATTVRRPGDPPGSCGALPPQLEIWNDRGEPCPPAEVDRAGNLLNRCEAVGEIVNTSGPGSFEGYYRNPEATAEKVRGGVFRSGDLGYCRIFERDGRPARFLYFAGRKDDWIRKDGENFLAEPIEEALGRYPDVLVASVYGVPCAEADEHIMTALVLTEGSRFDARAFYAFLTAQPDLSPKSLPDYVRLCAALPETRTLKVLRGDLKRAGFDPARCTDPIWWRERGESGFKPFAAADYAKVRAAFVRAGREAELLLP